MTEVNQVSRGNRRQGAVNMPVGLPWGLVVPAAPFPRFALATHVQLTQHGLMFLIG